MGDTNITINVTGNVTGNLVNVMRGIKSYNGEKSEDFSVKRKTTGFMLSLQRPDIFAVMAGQIRPTEEIDDAGTDGADTGRISPALLFTPGFADTSGGTLQQRQTAFDRANQNLYAILYLTAKAAALRVAMHACEERDTRGDGQKTMKTKLEEKYLRVTYQTIRALPAALVASTMRPDEDLDHYIVKGKRLVSRLTAVKEPVTEWHFKEIAVHVLPEKYRDIKLTTLKDPEFDLPKIQATMHHLYLDDLSRNKGKGKLIAERRGHVSGVSP